MKETIGTFDGVVPATGTGAARKRVFLTWLPYSQRSQTLAERLGARPVYFGYLSGRKSTPRAILRYLLMTLHTAGFLLRHRPRLVFVMNQPVFLPFVVYAVSFLLRYQYVIDSHSGLFNKPEWRWSLPIMKYVYRRSLFSIVTNREHRERVQSWGGRVEVLGALILGEEPADPFVRPLGPSLVVIGTFAADEPTAEVFEACRRMADIQFYVTGSLNKASPDLLKSAPGNVIFTDFMPRPKYVGLVKAMDGAIILVKNDNVMQRGAYEAMSWEVPIITSEWQLLRETFNRGAIFVDNSPEQIVRAVRQLLGHLQHYRAEIKALRVERAAQWESDIRRINAFLSS
ncbi:MAG TPA: glycosyltransferase [Acidobacteriota bacterium]|nr:glycosyltransferase [Acidobacteriota bacterium]